MKLLYATSLTFPSYRANRLQVMQTARAFAKELGANFRIGVCEGGEALALPVDTVLTVSNMRAWRLAWRYMQLVRKEKITHVYCREERLLACMYWYNRIWFRLPLTFCYELHHLNSTRGLWRPLFLHRMNRIISITSGMRDIVVAGGYSVFQTMVAPDAVDMELFNPAFSKKEARTALDLPEGKKDCHVYRRY